MLRIRQSFPYAKSTFIIVLLCIYLAVLMELRASKALYQIAYTTHPFSLRSYILVMEVASHPVKERFWRM